MNIKYAKRWLFEEDAGGGTGGASTESIFEGAASSEGQGSQAATTSGTTSGEGVATGGTGGEGASTGSAQAQQGQQEWTPEKITQLISEAAKAGASATGQQGPQGQQQQLSPEEVQQRLNAFSPTEAHIADLLEGGPKSVAAMKAIVEGAVKHATTVAWYQTQYAHNQLAEQINPLRSFYEQQQVEQLRNEFFTKHADLKPHTKLLGAVKASLDQEGAFKGKSKEQGFELIAQRAKEVLAASGQGGGTNGGNSGMASLSRGSQHGSSATKGGGGAAPSDAEAIFGG